MSPTIEINDLFSIERLLEETQAKYVARKLSPDGSMCLWTYTHKAQYENQWNEVTTQCRGLVTDAATGEVLARPFDKFFNYGQEGSPKWEPETPVVAYDKLDGSLAILLPDETLVTKGSFLSEQAKVATEIYQEKYSGKWSPGPGLTYMFEVIYPEGRIVLDYEGQRDLVLLGAREINTGTVYDPWALEDDTDPWPGPLPQRIGEFMEPFGDVLNHPPRANAEGLVLHGIHDRKMVKLKYDEYKKLHAIVTNTSALTLWEALSVWDMMGIGIEDELMTNSLGIGPKRIEEVQALGGHWEERIIEGVPDEFHEWVTDVLQVLSDKFENGIEQMEHYAQGAVKASGWDPENTQAMYEHLKPLEEEIRAEANLPMGTVLSYAIHKARGHVTDGLMDSRIRGSVWKSVRPKGNELPEVKKRVAAGVN